jgi:hypothetical protein
LEVAIELESAKLSLADITLAMVRSEI